MERRKRETSLIALVEQSRQSYLLFGSRKVFHINLFLMKKKMFIIKDDGCNLRVSKRIPKRVPESM